MTYLLQAVEPPHATLGGDFAEDLHPLCFGRFPATFKTVSDTYLTATVPVGANTGSVSVVISAGTLTSSHIFLVVPTIKTFSPTSGPVGTAVTITGGGLIQATTVTFGGRKSSCVHREQ